MSTNMTSVFDRPPSASDMISFGGAPVSVAGRLTVSPHRLVCATNALLTMLLTLAACTARRSASFSPEYPACSDTAASGST
jgi:hypothetical protein